MSLAQKITSTLDNECSKQRLIKTQEYRLSDALIIMLIKCLLTKSVEGGHNSDK